MTPKGNLERGGVPPSESDKTYYVNLTHQLPVGSECAKTTLACFLSGFARIDFRRSRRPRVLGYRRCLSRAAYHDGPSASEIAAAGDQRREPGRVTFGGGRRSSLVEPK